MYSGAADVRTKVERERDAMLAYVRQRKPKAGTYQDEWLTLYGMGVRVRYGVRHAGYRAWYQTYARYQRRVRRAWQRCCRRDVATVLDGLLAVQALADERDGTQVRL